MPVRFRPPVPVCVGVAQLDESAGFRSPSALLKQKRFNSSRSLQILNFGDQGNGLTRLAWDQEILGSNPRSPTMFRSAVAKLGRHLTVSQAMRRFDSCPRSQVRQRRGRLLVEGPSPTKRCSRVRSSTPVPDDCAPVPRGFRHRSSKAIHAGSSPARRSTPRSFNGRTKVFEAFYVVSIPAVDAKVRAGVVYGAPADL